MLMLEGVRFFYLNELHEGFILLPVFLEALHSCPVHLHIVLVEPQATALGK